MISSIRVAILSVRYLTAAISYELFDYCFETFKNECYNSLVLIDYYNWDDLLELILLFYEKDSSFSIFSAIF